MSDSRWWTAKQELAAYREHISELPSGTPRAFMLSKDDIDTLLNQKTGGLDGIRIYIGAKTVSDTLVTTLAIVGTELVNGVQEDYGVPASINPPSFARSSSTNGGGEGEEEEEESTSLASPRPCPMVCGGDNALNSEEP